MRSDRTDLNVESRSTLLTLEQDSASSRFRLKPSCCSAQPPAPTRPHALSSQASCRPQAWISPQRSHRKLYSPRSASNADGRSLKTVLTTDPVTGHLITTR